MNLYHGTYTDNFVKIVENGGYIKTNNDYQCVKDSITELLDELIIKYTGKDFRNNCIYLSDDNDCTQGFDYAFTIDIDDLDFYKLYVAENSFLDEILCLYYENDVERLILKVEEYFESYVPYNEYLDNDNYYKNPEYLYYDNIVVEITDEDIEEVCNINNI